MPKYSHYRPRPIFSHNPSSQSNPASKKAQITKCDKPGFVGVITPYNSKFVESLKIAIPYPHRQWEQENCRWIVSESYLEDLIKLLQNYFDEVTTDINNEEQTTLATPQNLFKAIFDLLPNEYVTKVYNALAQALHPDHGGSTEQMSQLNQAYQEKMAK